MTTDDFDFKNYPTGINENKGDIEDWTPREAVLHALRAMDNGTLDTDTLVIGWTTIGTDGKPTWGYNIAAKSRFELIGMLMHLVRKFTNVP